MAPSPPTPPDAIAKAASLDPLDEQEMRLRALARGLFRRVASGQAQLLTAYLATEAQLRATVQAREARKAVGDPRAEWEAELAASAGEVRQRLLEKIHCALGVRSGVVILPPLDPEGTAPADGDE